MSQTTDYRPFLEILQKKFKVLDQEGGLHFHYWYGDSKSAIRLASGASFPKLTVLAKMNALPEKVALLCMSDLDQELFYGAVVAKITSKDQMELISFIINPVFRNQGLGAKLLSKADDFGRAFKVHTLEVKYRTYWKMNEVWEKLLSKSGWSDPELLMWYVSMPDANVQYSKDWLKNSKIEAPFEVEDWNETSYAQLEEALKGTHWQGIVRKELNPFQLRELIQPHVSFLLKKEGAIVGWLVCHLVQEGVVQCSSLFLHPDKARGQGLNMMGEAFKRRKLGARVIWMIEKHNTPMLNMTKKYVAGDQVDLFENRRRSKHIS